MQMQHLNSTPHLDSEFPQLASLLHFNTHLQNTRKMRPKEKEEKKEKKEKKMMMISCLFLLGEDQEIEEEEEKWS